MISKDYSKEYKIPLYDNIKNLEEFEEANRDFLETKEGRHEYEIFKNIMKGVKIEKKDYFLDDK